MEIDVINIEENRLKPLMVGPVSHGLLKIRLSIQKRALKAIIAGILI